jgi:hypothetical protein
MENNHPTRSVPQVHKNTNDYLSFHKTLTRVARFHPEDKGDFKLAKQRSLELMPWLPEELEALRGEKYTSKLDNDRAGTLISTLTKYDPRNWDYWGRPGYVMSLKKQAECKLALDVLKRGTPITKEELKGMFFGQASLLPEDLRSRVTKEHPETQFVSIVKHDNTNPQTTKLGLSKHPEQRMQEYRTFANCTLFCSYEIEYNLAGWVDFELKKMFSLLRAPHSGPEVFVMQPEEMEREIDAFLWFHEIPIRKTFGKNGEEQ